MNKKEVITKSQPVSKSKPDNYCPSIDADSVGASGQKHTKNTKVDGKVCLTKHEYKLQ